MVNRRSDHILVTFGLRLWRWDAEINASLCSPRLFK